VKPWFPEVRPLASIEKVETTIRGRVFVLFLGIFGGKRAEPKRKGQRWKARDCQKTGRPPPRMWPKKRISTPRMPKNGQLLLWEKNQSPKIEKQRLIFCDAPLKTAQAGQKGKTHLGGGDVRGGPKGKKNPPRCGVNFFPCRERI